jgi:exopolysaccharide biosynthesis polyprenyl glycosylphosphotransferase
MTPHPSQSALVLDRPEKPVKPLEEPDDKTCIGSYPGGLSGRSDRPVEKALAGAPAEQFGGVIDIRRGTAVHGLATAKRNDTGEKNSFHLNRYLRQALLAASGQTGASIVSALYLWTCLSLGRLSGSWLWQPIIALLLIRTWYFHTRGPKPVLAQYKVRKRVWRIVVDEGKIGLIFFGVCFITGWPITGSIAGLFAAGNFVLQLCLMSFSRLVIKFLADYDKMAGSTDTMGQKAIIVGTGDNGKKVADMVMGSPELDTRLVGFLDYSRQGYWRYHDVPLIGHPDSLEHIAAETQIDAIFWALEPDDVPHSWKLMEMAEKMGIRVFVMPSLYTPKVSRIRPTYINGHPAMVYRSEPESHLPLLVKAIVDRIGAMFGVLMSAPVMLFTALAIKLDSRGPVFFKQTRLGLNGKPFTMLKFRTMCSDAEGKKRGLMEKNEMSGPVFKIKEDPRVTRVGKYLRKFSVDELPQFLNVLTGDMSLVGPRPPLPAEVRRFEPWQHRKLSVRPGLTCLWQVNGRNSIDFEEWMLLDLHYIDNWSLWLDAKILAKTIPTVFKGSGQ